MPEKFRNQVRFQNGQLIDLAILKPGFELARPFQNQGRFQNGQVYDLAVSKRPMAVSKRPGYQNGQEHIYYHKVWTKVRTSLPSNISKIFSTLQIQVDNV